MTDHATFVIFLHVLSAVVWVGGMVALWFFAKFLSKNPSSVDALSGTTALFKKFFIFLTPFIVVLFVTSIFMALGYKDNAIDVHGFTLDAYNLAIYKYINTKGSIWTIMTLNMLFMSMIFTRASCQLCKGRKAEDCMWLVMTYLLPINIILGIVEIFMGVFLRNSF
jgi:uncharacterized membrane protein